MPSKSFGTWLREQRAALGLTQLELADLTGILNVTISNYELDQRLPSLENAVILAAELHVEQAELITRLMKARLMKTVEGRILMAEFREGRFYDDER